MLNTWDNTEQQGGIQFMVVVTWVVPSHTFKITLNEGEHPMFQCPLLTSCSTFLSAPPILFDSHRLSTSPTRGMGCFSNSINHPTRSVETGKQTTTPIPPTLQIWDTGVGDD